MAVTAVGYSLPRSELYAVRTIVIGMHCRRGDLIENAKLLAKALRHTTTHLSMLIAPTEQSSEGARSIVMARTRGCPRRDAGSSPSDSATRAALELDALSGLALG